MSWVREHSHSAIYVGLTLAVYLTIYAVLIAAYISVVFYLARQAGSAGAKAAEPVAHGPGILPSGAAASADHA